ncbi:MAG: hypothetical protein M1828_001274 [Chrysothrix sp. TS-e1954]|nr:MAG: hypothetical protein M1828_001274 [Chrysothrix sp. TS-e1954]
MAATATSDGSENVEDFLRRIKSLGDSHEDEEAERMRKLDQDILDGRKQREARRSERARSLSPEKQSPSTTPRSVRSPKPAQRQDETSNTPLSSRTRILSLDDSLEAADATPRPSSPTPAQLSSQPSRPERTSRSNTPVKDNALTPTKSPSSPLSQYAKSSEVKSSAFMSPTLATSGSSPSNTSLVLPSVETEPEKSRTSIAQSLGSKDPAWFRQTAERGIGSAAYRRNVGAAETGRVPSFERRQLHGLGTQSDSRSQPSPPSSVRSHSPSTLSLTRDGHRTISSTTSESMRDGQDESTAMPTKSSQIFQPPSNDSTQSMLPSEVASMVPPERLARRGSPHSLERGERPSSPTKGLGGFVQSAMLRRSDSISKRWTVQGASGLSRPQNTSPTRGESPAHKDSFKGHSAKLGNSSASTSRENSVEPSSRPGSSRNNISNAGTNDTKSPSSLVSPENPSVSPPNPSEEVLEKDRESTDHASATSPSKRWSPTKASWLESALTKPETPKKSASVSQPQWMSDLSKSRQQRMSKDIGRTDSQSSSKGAESKVGDSLESSPATNTTHASSTRPKPARPSHEVANNRVSSTSSGPVETPRQTSSSSNTSLTTVRSQTRPEIPPKKQLSSPVKVDRGPESESQSGGPEFLKAFGTLKRTKTQNYVAPDTFGNNIRRGKADLSVTGGPQKTQRRDEFKESLISQRETMKTAAAETPKPDLTRDAKVKASPPIPEALAKKKALGKTSSSGNILNDEKQTIVKRPEERNVEHVASPAILIPTAKHESLNQEVKSPSTTMAKTDSDFANRLNPALAGVLARGRPVSTPSSGADTPAHDAHLSRVESDSVVGEASGNLQHITKARARGPKRRPPKATETQQASTASSPPTKSESVYLQNERLDGRQAQTNQLLKSPISAMQVKEPSKAQSSSANSEREVEVSEEPMISVKNAASTWGQRSTTNDHGVSARTPIKLPSWKDGETAVEQTSSRHDMKQELKGPSLPLEPLAPGIPSSTKSFQREAKVNIGTAPRLGAGSSSHSGPKPQPPSKPSEAIKAAISSAKPIPTPSQEIDVNKALNDIFDEPPKAHGNLDIDTKAILSATTEDVKKIKTLRKTINEISADGITSPMPANQEHVLYSNAMYLCTHVYGDSRGARITDVYLWTGASVSSPSLKSVEPFARKTAKDVAGNLCVMQQGKESTEFFLALGGIVITRMGSSAEQDKSFMLCGRHHLGHIAFDEVPFALSSLCSGFPYIVNQSTQQQLYLWKGIGCDAEELGCARLIGMDLVPSASVVEVEEGKEDKDFLGLFPANMEIKNGTWSQSADHWKLKPKHESYRTRLFRVQPSNVSTSTNSMWTLMQRRGSRPGSAHATGKANVSEIKPFAQSDLDPEGIFVLDAFFEIYVLVGPLSSAHASVFASALMFAQDYGMLAASTEDRPFVPKSMVVLEGAPHDMKACFRGWNDDRIDSSSLMAGKQKTSQPKVVPLTAALDVLKR